MSGRKRWREKRHGTTSKKFENLSRTPKLNHREPMSNEITTYAKEGLDSSDLFSSPLNHLVVLHRVLYGTIEPELALAYLHQHLRHDADLADMGRPLKFQYQENS